jgi:predicted kinase
MKVYQTIGFMGSGKSTWARRFALDNPNTKIISTDSLRTMLNGTYKYIEGLDDAIDQIVRETLIILLANGYDVIIDCCHLTHERRDSWDIPEDVDRVAVVFPRKCPTWHVKNRESDRHSDADLIALITSDIKHYQEIRPELYSDVINISA